jgi:hypothetical protein
VAADYHDRVRRNRKGKPIAALAATLPRLEAPQPVDAQIIEHQQAALNLVQLSGQAGAGIATLVDTLLVSFSHDPTAQSRLAHMLTHDIQDNADPAVIALMARANPQHLTDVAKLNLSDEQGLRAMLAQMEAMEAQIKELLVRRGDMVSPSTPISAEKLPDNYRRPSTPRRPFDALLASLPVDPAAPVASEAEEHKELPSPPATDQPDEKPKCDNEGDVIVAASDSPAAEIKAEDQEEDGMDLD